MRLAQFLRSLYEVHRIEDKKTDFFRNPSPGELLGLLQRTKRGVLRGVIAGEDLFVWDGHDRIHQQGFRDLLNLGEIENNLQMIFYYVLIMFTNQDQILLRGYDFQEHPLHDLDAVPSEPLQRLRRGIQLNNERLLRRPELASYRLKVDE
jgi:hypothetical protein